MDEKRSMFNNIFFEKITTEMPAEMSEIVVINDNNNFASSLFRSLCEIVSDCFDALIVFVGSCAASEKYLRQKQSPPVSHNDFKNDGVQLLLSI